VLAPAPRTSGREGLFTGTQPWNKLSFPRTPSAPQSEDFAPRCGTGSTVTAVCWLHSSEVNAEELCGPSLPLATSSQLWAELLHLKHDECTMHLATNRHEPLSGASNHCRAQGKGSATERATGPIDDEAPVRPPPSRAARSLPGGCG